MPDLDNLIFVDCEARGASAVNGTMTEFGAVHFTSHATFYGQLFESTPDPANPAIPVIGARLATDAFVAAEFAHWLKLMTASSIRPVFVSDNPAYDWQWIAALFDTGGQANPFGHSGRRISDFWAGLQGDWRTTQSWKALRKTRHDHNPVNDAMGNVEAFEQILEIMRTRQAVS